MTISLLYRILYWAWIASEATIAIATRTRAGKGEVHDRGSMLLIWIVVVNSITACEWISAVVRAPLFDGAEWLLPLSLLVLLAGLAIRWTAIWSLGKAFSPNVAIRAAQQLNQQGLYRYVRHPSYLGLLLVFFAIGLHTRNWIGLTVVMLPTTAALIYRIHLEEAVLHQAFGAQYAEYSKTSKRLVPGLY